MKRCYAEVLGDCAGALEDEHFISHAIQRMLGPVTINGLKWTERRPLKQVNPGSYAHAKLLCQKHHDELDGLDGNALAYFRNLMLILGQKHLATGVMGRSEDIQPTIDGRALERWFLKLLCGGFNSKAFARNTEVPRQWIDALFLRVAWPIEYAFYVISGTRVTRASDGRLRIDFHWADDQSLNAVIVDAFASTTVFSIVPPDTLGKASVCRPSELTFKIERPAGGDILEDIPAEQLVSFSCRWPVGIACALPYIGNMYQLCSWDQTGRRLDSRK